MLRSLSLVLGLGLSILLLAGGCMGLLPGGHESSPSGAPSAGPSASCSSPAPRGASSRIGPVPTASSGGLPDGYGGRRADDALRLAVQGLPEEGPDGEGGDSAHHEALSPRGPDDAPARSSRRREPLIASSGGLRGGAGGRFRTWSAQDPNG